MGSAFGAQRASTELPADRRQKTEEDTAIVAENPEQSGESYIKAQQNLPDVIVVGGDGSGSAPAPSGVEP